MKFIKNGEIFETPITTVIGGVEVELTTEQLVELGYEELDVVLNKQRNDFGENPLSINKLEILLNSIKVVDSEGNEISNEESSDYVNAKFPVKVGYKWVPVFNGSVIQFESVIDPNAFGTSEKPFIFVDGIKCIPNAYYIYNKIKYVYVGTQVTYGSWWGEVSMDMEPMEINEEDQPKIDNESGKTITNDADHPFEFFNGIALTPNTYYSYEGHTYVYLGVAGVSTTFEACGDDMVQWDL